MSKKKLTLNDLKALSISDDAQLQANGGYIHHASKRARSRAGQISIIVDDLIDIRFQGDRGKGRFLGNINKI